MTRANSGAVQQDEALEPWHLAVEGKGAVLRALAASAAASPVVCTQESGGLGKSGRLTSQGALGVRGFRETDRIARRLCHNFRCP